MDLPSAGSSTGSFSPKTCRNRQLSEQADIAASVRCEREQIDGRQEQQSATSSSAALRGLRRGACGGKTQRRFHRRGANRAFTVAERAAQGSAAQRGAVARSPVWLLGPAHGQRQGLHAMLSAVIRVSIGSIIYK
eukprot:6196166-Pleurochrysis_carterae.AAC.4